jgi:hypothetical protein
MKYGHKAHLDTRNTFSKEVFPKFKDFPFNFALTEDTYGLEMNSQNLQIEGAKSIRLPQD